MKSKITLLSTVVLSISAVALITSGGDPLKKKLNTSDTVNEGMVHPNVRNGKFLV